LSGRTAIRVPPTESDSLPALGRAQGAVAATVRYFREMSTSNPG
jgi:hypothetical protein